MLASEHRLGTGGASISLVEPHVGSEYTCNRWYEDDHFSARLALPWLFAGRRYVDELR